MSELDKLQKKALLIKRKQIKEKIRLLKKLKLAKQDEIIRRQRVANQQEMEKIRKRITQAKKRLPEEAAERRRKLERVKALKKNISIGIKATAKGGKEVIKSLDRGLAAIFGNPPKRKKRYAK